MRDVAARAAVSIKTVSRVINHENEISDGTRRRVLQVIEELGYRPNLAARGLVTRRTGLIGLVLPDITNPFFAEVTRGVQSVARDNGFGLLICNVDEYADLERQALESLAAQAVEGIIVCASYVTGLTLPAFVQRANLPPLVLLNYALEHPNVTCIGTRNFEGGCQVMDYLIAARHRRIGMLAPYSHSDHTPRRLRAYRAAFERHNLPASPDWVTHSHPTIAGGYASARNLLSAQKLTALFCYNDMMAIGAMRACAELGLRVPDDVAIVGYDDIQLAEAVSPALTTIHVDTIGLGRTAMMRMLDRIQNPQSDLRQDEIDVYLVRRQSA